jgi:hypothetical protein
MAIAEWTGARLTDAFEALRADNARLREEMRELRDDLRAEMRLLREDMRRDTEDMRGDMAALRSDFHADVRMLWVTLVACYVSFVAAFVATQL